MTTAPWQRLADQLSALLEGESDFIVILANASAFLMDQLADVNWVGFYLHAEGELLLGPFQGKPACAHIPIGRGVCGTAFALRESILVNDVHTFPGHIACDTASRSELVIPIFDNRQMPIGVLDLDSPLIGRFTEADRIGLEKIARLIGALLFPPEAGQKTDS